MKKTTTEEVATMTEEAKTTDAEGKRWTANRRHPCGANGQEVAERQHTLTDCAQSSEAAGEQRTRAHDLCPHCKKRTCAR